MTLWFSVVRIFSRFKTTSDLQERRNTKNNVKADMASEGLKSEGFHLKVFRWGVRHLRVGSKIIKTLVN